jgi:serine/threonine protein kinase
MKQVEGTARRFEPLRSAGPRGSTVDSEADMLAAALLERGRRGMSVQREFADGDVVPGTRYRVIGLIGSGGMGSVYEVEHEELGKRFVLKALLRSLTNRDDLVHRLRNEWRALGRLEHPNIVSVTDAGLTTTGVPFYVMERLQGETLSARLRRERRLRLPDALGIAAEVLEGLSAAHRIGIVHRDVKPPNIFLVGGRVAKLLDFGIAKMLDPKASQITGRGIAIGTPRYMAPEQATGGTIDARTDLYATGLILFEMIAGTGPFDAARDANELFLAHLAKDAPPVSTTAPGVPAELDRWMTRLLAKRSEDRPADAAAVATYLRELRQRLSGVPHSASSSSGPDDRTNPGGPFDTLEAAHTVPSERPEASHGRRSLNDATTRTGIGPHGSDAQSGKTLRFDALDMDEPLEAPTRTATPLQMAPLAQLETPPPVEPAPVVARPASSARRPYVVAVVALGAVAAIAAAVGFRLRQTPDPTDDASRAPAAAVERAVPAVAPPAAPPAPAVLAIPDASAGPIAPPASAAKSPKTPGSASAADLVPVRAASAVSAAAVHRVSAAHSAPAPKAPTSPADPAPLPGSGL